MWLHEFCHWLWHLLFKTIISLPHIYFGPVAFLFLPLTYFPIQHAYKKSTIFKAVCLCFSVWSSGLYVVSSHPVLQVCLHPSACLILLKALCLLACFLCLLVWINKWFFNHLIFILSLLFLTEKLSMHFDRIVYSFFRILGLISHSPLFSTAKSFSGC